MFEKDYEIKSYALNMWANWIETYDVTISAEDAHRMNKKSSLQYLTIEQQKFVIRLRELSQKILNEKS